MEREREKEEKRERSQNITFMMTFLYQPMLSFGEEFELPCLYQALLSTVGFFFFLVTFSFCPQTCDIQQVTLNIGKDKSSLVSQSFNNAEESCSGLLSEMMYLSPIFLLFPV